MEFSVTDINVLKKFKNIDNKVILNPGSITISSEVDGVIAHYKFEKPYDFSKVEGKKIGISNITEFLNVLGLMKNCDIEVGEKSFVIRDGSAKLRYNYSVIVNPADLEHPMIFEPNLQLYDNVMSKLEEVTSFNITWEDITKVLDFKTALKLPHIYFGVEDDKVKVSVCKDIKDVTDNYSELFISSIKRLEMTDPFRIEIDTSYLVPENYEITMGKVVNQKKNKTIYAMRWVSESGVVYQIAPSVDVDNKQDN